jgi:hypothetical protein
LTHGHPVADYPQRSGKLHGKLLQACDEAASSGVCEACDAGVHIHMHGYHMLGAKSPSLESLHVRHHGVTVVHVEEVEGGPIRDMIAKKGSRPQRPRRVCRVRVAQQWP